MFGGRTSYFAHHYRCGEDERISFKDFVSLYPSQMINKEYPVGEPTVINDHFDRFDPAQYWGLVKAIVLPPDDCFVGVLPYRADGRLVFPLCAACADSQSADCRHDDDDRALHGTWTTFELAAATGVGYRITHVCQVWHWPPEKRSKNIYGPYLIRLLGQKMISKRLPDDWSRARKAAYVTRLNRQYGFNFTPADFKDNPGMKLIAKTYLNCLWGRITLNAFGSEFRILDGYEAVWKKLTDPNIIVQDYAPVSDTKMAVSFKPADNKAPDQPTVSLLVGIWTCSYGRLDLLAALQKVVREAGPEALLYCDTDSILHAEKRDTQILPTGENLGDLADEVGDDVRITAFCCAAPKVYALEMRKADGSVEYRQKFKGFPNTWRSNQTLNGELFMKQFLRDYERLRVDVRLENRLRKNKWTSEIRTVGEEKRLRFVSRKRYHATGEYITYPFGYRLAP